MEQGGWCDPPRVWLLIELELIKKPARCSSRDEAVDTRVQGPGSTGDLWGQVNEQKMAKMRLRRLLRTYLRKLEPRFIDQNSPYGLKNTMRCLSDPHERFLRVKIQEMIFGHFFFGVFHDFHDPISTHMNDKGMPNLKSAHQITPGAKNTRKMT